MASAIVTSISNKVSLLGATNAPTVSSPTALGTPHLTTPTAADTNDTQFIPTSDSSHTGFIPISDSRVVNTVITPIKHQTLNHSSSSGSSSNIRQHDAQGFIVSLPSSTPKIHSIGQSIPNTFPSQRLSSDGTNLLHNEDPLKFVGRRSEDISVVNGETVARSSEKSRTEYPPFNDSSEAERERDSSADVGVARGGERMETEDGRGGIRAGSKRERSGKKSKAKRPRRDSHKKSSKTVGSANSQAGIEINSVTMSTGNSLSSAHQIRMNSEASLNQPSVALSQSSIATSVSPSVESNIRLGPNPGSAFPHGTETVVSPFQIGNGTNPISHSENPLLTPQRHQHSTISEPVQRGRAIVQTSTATPISHLTTPTSIPPTPTSKPVRLVPEFGHILVKKEPGLDTDESEEHRPPVSKVQCICTN